MEFYTVEDVTKILKVSRSYGYKVIRKLRKEFREEYKDVFMVRGRIPKWFFEKKFKNREE